jgi:hypothetical protein
MTYKTPDDVIEAAAEAYFLASERDIGFDDSTWDGADESERDRFRWAVRQSAPIIARAALEAARDMLAKSPAATIAGIGGGLELLDALIGSGETTDE